MKIAVTTPTGHIGSKLANILLDRGDELTLVARNPEKVNGLRSRGASVVAGEHDDPQVLEQAVKRADALFWVAPPNITSHDPVGFYRHFADEGAKVIGKHPELLVILVSSVGANLPSGTGPIAGLYETEERFRAVGKNVISLRANYFMENIFSSLPTIISDSAIYSVVPGDVRVPQIATADIARIAAEQLLNPQRGHHTLDLVGPVEISFDEVASRLTGATGKAIRHVVVPGETLKQGMVHGGLSIEMAELLVEMQEAMTRELGQELRGEKKLTGKITFDQFVQEVFLPVYQSATQVARAS